MNTALRLLVGISLVLSSVHAGAIGQCRDLFRLRTLSVSYVSPELRKAVRLVEQDQKLESSDIQRLQLELSKIDGELNGLNESLTRFEAAIQKRLSKITGFKTPRIRRIEDLKEIRKQLEARINNDEEYQQQAARDILIKIEIWLRQNNRQFRALYEFKQSLARILCEGENCIAKYDSTMETLRRVRAIELVDIVSNDGPVTVTSKISTGVANKVVEDLIKEIQRYQMFLLESEQSLTQKNERLKAVDELSDFVFDRTFEPSNELFIVSNYIAVGDKKRKIIELGKTLQHIHSIVVTDYNLLNTEMKRVLCEVRDICLND